jgi:hypothetical protein
MPAAVADKPLPIPVAVARAAGDSSAAAAVILLPPVNIHSTPIPIKAADTGF